MLRDLCLILCLPLAAFVVQLAVGRRLPRQGDFVSIGAIFAGLLLAVRLFALFVIVLAAAEAAVALAIILAIYHNFQTIDVNEIDSLRD